MGMTLFPKTNRDPEFFMGPENYNRSGTCVGTPKTDQGKKDEVKVPE